MKILSTNIANSKTREIARDVAGTYMRKGYAPYALVVFTSETAAHVSYYNTNEIGLRAKAAAMLRMQFAVIEMAA